MKRHSIGAKHSIRCILVTAIVVMTMGLIGLTAMTEVQADALDAPEAGELTETPMSTFLLLAVLVLIWLMSALFFIMRIRRGPL